MKKLLTCKNTALLKTKTFFNKLLLYFSFIYLTFIFLCAWPTKTEAKESHCPQPRFTQQAPSDFLDLKNPLEPTAKNIKKGKLLYLTKAKPMPCKMCHGVDGDGHGPMAKKLKPAPRNFTCAKTINGVSDGQLFWVIQNGSPKTGMMGFKTLKDDQIWQLILYIRHLATDIS